MIAFLFSLSRVLMRFLILLVIQGILLDRTFFAGEVHVYLILLGKVLSKFPTCHLGHC